MADDGRTHPPTDRKLARLWNEGVTPASPALVALGVMAAAWSLTVLLWPALLAGAAQLLCDAFALAASPEDAPAAAAGPALRGLAVIAAGASAPLAVALTLQAILAGPRPSGPGQAGPSRLSVGMLRPSLSTARGVLGVLLLVLVSVTISALVRTILWHGEDLACGGDPLTAASELASVVGWPVLAVLAGVALLDVAIRKVEWRRLAWMSRRELEEELRHSEGRPTAHQPRALGRRRGADA